MTGKGASNALESRAYINGRSFLSIKHEYIHCEVCDVYGNGQMSNILVGWRVAYEHLKDAVR
jgi:hypothetical protein